MNKYIALTIGPIYRTMESCQRTRMVWGASFLFSYLIRKLTKLLKFNSVCKISGDIIIPYSNGIEKDTFKNGEGKYPDRILIRSEEGDYGKVKIAIGILIEFLGDEIAKHLKKSDEKAQIVKDLTDYLQFYIVEADEEVKLPDEEGKEPKTIMLKLYKMLDVLECRGNYIANDKGKNYLFYYLFYVSLKRDDYSLLAKEAFPSKENKRFRSVIEIATASYEYTDSREYKKLIDEKFIFKAKKDIPNELPNFQGDKFKDDDDFQDEFIEELKSDRFKSPFKKYHQYFAVIYADGDHIGTTLGEIGNCSKSLLGFSEKLLDFSSKVEKVISNYGGAPVYIGGEDIFAFVPLVSFYEDERKNIFSLIKSLDKEFDKIFTKGYADSLKVIKPTLSFGIAVSYFKNPLMEAMKMAHECLIEAKSKNAKDKNAIVLMLEEHSGQQFKLFIEKGKNESYGKIQSLIEKLTKELFEKGKTLEKGFVNSIAHKLKEPLFKTLLLKAHEKERLNEFFENTFNEPIHKGDMKSYIKDVRELTSLIFEDYKEYEVNNEDKDDVRINNLYSTLRFIDFLHKDPKD